MDKIDIKILSLLQENSRYPLKFLAEKVFLSSPAVSARIERLEKQGIITGYHATLDPLTLGFHITAFINLTLEPHQNPAQMYLSATVSQAHTQCLSRSAFLARRSSITSSVSFRPTEKQRHRLSSQHRFHQEESTSLLSRTGKLVKSKNKL